MSGKSRRRGRRLSRSQRRKLGRVVAAPVVESAAPTAQKPAPAPTPKAAPAVTRAPAARMAVQAAPPDVSGELKRIGIVGGIVVVLLVAAYFVLPLF
jgi:hypothetical protein